MLEEKICIEVNQSKFNKSSTDFIKRFVLSIVEEALIQVYGENYSTRCLQSSVGIQKLLDDFGIRSQLFEGSCCFSTIRGNNPYEFSWGGFWNNDHHIWLQTELFEIVDFTISKLNQHPNFIDNENVQPIPVIWWSPANIIPPIFRYLPRKLNVTVTVQLYGKEKEDLDKFLIKIEEIKTQKVKANIVNILLFQNEILEGPESLNMLFEKGNHWARGSFFAQEKKIAFPNWILEKERELIKEL